MRSRRPLPAYRIRVVSRRYAAISPRNRCWPSTLKWCSTSVWYGSSVPTSTSACTPASSASVCSHAAFTFSASAVRSGGRTPSTARATVREQLPDAAGLDRLDLQPRQAEFEPVAQQRELLALGQVGRLRRRPRRRGVLRRVEPQLRRRAEQQRVVRSPRPSGRLSRSSSGRRPLSPVTQRSHLFSTNANARRCRCSLNRSQPSWSWYFSCEPT